MRATLQTKKDRENYYVVLDYIDETTGKRKLKWISTNISKNGNTKREANARLKEILKEYEDKQVDLSNNVLFVDYLKQWLENHKQSIEGVTYDTYWLIVYHQIIPFFEPKKLKVKDVTPLHIQQYVNNKLKTISANTVIKHLWNISQCLDTAIKHRIITFNPVNMIDKPKKVRYTGAKSYNENQMAKLMNAIKGDIIEFVIQFALFYGLRRSEILGLKWNAIDLENNTFTVQHTVVRVDKIVHKKDRTKTKSSYRVMPIPQIIKDMLYALKAKQDEYRALQPNDYVDEGYIFTNIDGKLILPNYVTKHFKYLLVKNNLPVIRFHDLRHSSGTYLLYLGRSMKEIQTWLGHENLGTTMDIYAHLDLAAMQDIANKLNDKFIEMGNKSLV